MTIWLSIGILFTFSTIVFVLLRWGNMKCVGVTPVRTFAFIAILFTSGLDVGLIMFPLTEFAGYADLATNPEYGFSNPLAIEFGFWAFFIWAFYFLTCFYFCVIEPRVKFFEIPLVKFINNLVIIGTSAFTAYLLLANLPWYLPELGDGESIVGTFYLVVFAVIAISVYSSTSIRYVRVLSLGSSWLFLSLIVMMWSTAFLSETSNVGEFFTTIALLGDYFTNLEHFILPINDYHEFYLYWWFAWSIMIGQFTSRFVGGMRTYQVLIAMMVLPSIPIAIWFSVLYYYSANAIPISSFYNLAMVFVGVTFVINSLDSLVRLYTDNLNLTVKRFGKVKYVVGNITFLSGLTLLFKLDFLQIQWVGALAIALVLACFSYILVSHYRKVAAIDSSPAENKIDFHKIELVN
ncbi:BCCT family transporter [Vibrio sp. V27_P1S3P104]|uniref:BCCT family transporter n=1 Tax=unclassified Vibrio TaxID=2614977 RepID=UPI00137348AD|nr:MULTISPECIES: BCCT family transporter [unclassified Vibrio]NAW68239.1 BCCT family transporter [Vibrio sp. V28_P6S34P95]NAX05625.1 BCCT family transporter [Vibrio sp. V30_P3S12P165]NAX33034.1 BCCT family transporter [Vibrio sp. V29_P1S30P107]NAX38572.1 BCCT family transporter [Vibrio sp. V27_P1S3P104]NAX40523.1 BCCT family transporter [Vibrio sp. V26_P1S5P106]